MPMKLVLRDALIFRLNREEDSFLDKVLHTKFRMKNILGTFTSSKLFADPVPSIRK